MRENWVLMDLFVKVNFISVPLERSEIHPRLQWAADQPVTLQRRGFLFTLFAEGCSSRR